MTGNREADFKERPLNSGRVSSRFALLVRKYGGSPRLLRKIREVTKDQEPVSGASLAVSGVGGSRATNGAGDSWSRRNAPRLIDKNPDSTDSGQWAGLPEVRQNPSELPESERPYVFIHELIAEQLERTREVLKSLPSPDLVVLYDARKLPLLLEVKHVASPASAFDRGQHLDLRSSVVRPDWMGGFEKLALFRRRSEGEIKSPADVDAVPILETRIPRGRLAASTDLAVIGQLVTGMANRLGGDHPTVLVGRRLWAEIQAEYGDVSGAHAALRDVVSDLTRILGAAHAETVAARMSLRELGAGKARK